MKKEELKLKWEVTEEFLRQFSYSYEEDCNEECKESVRRVFISIF